MQEIGKEAEFTIFVGDLGPEVTEVMLRSAFQSKYTSIVNPRVIMDPNTNQSKRNIPKSVLDFL